MPSYSPYIECDVCGSVFMGLFGSSTETTLSNLWDDAEEHENWWVNSDNADQILCNLHNTPENRLRITAED